MGVTDLARRLATGLTSSTKAGGRAYRRVITAGRWFIVMLWIGAAVVVNLLFPAHGSDGGGFGDLLPPDSAVLRVESRILDQFTVPVLSGTTVVLHQEGGLSPMTRADSILWALATTQTVLDAPEPPVPGQIIAAIPVPTGRDDTMATYLYMSDGTGLYNTVRLANEYSAHFKNQASARAYVTGFVPAQVAQGQYLRARLPLFEIASLMLILLVVALAFRSLLAPLVVVGVAAVGYFVYMPSLSRLADLLGFEVPSQLEPLLLALLLGVVTDYCVLLFSDLRDELKLEPDQHRASIAALKRNGSVIAVAGLTVAGGTIALLAAPFAIFRGLGPALALTVLVGLAVCLTLTPALMAILGWRLFTVLPVQGSAVADVKAQARIQATMDVRRNRGIKLLTRRGPALAATALVVVLLGLATIPLAQARLDLSFTAGLPASDAVAEGADILSAAGLRGISAPTEVLVEQPGINTRRSELSRLEQLIDQQPGVARVLGPRDAPLTKVRGLVLSETGDAARYVVIYDTDPLAATAIEHVRQLQADLPQLLRDAGLREATVSTTGQTLIAAEVADLTRQSLTATLVAALIIELLILSLYLRALVAPIVLLASSVLSVAAAIGLTTLVFQGFLGAQGLTFYAPFCAAVLLIALGSDYNVFVVGSIWSEASHRPLADALEVAVPRSARAITTAGLILAATFALVAVIPLATFRQIAFAMAVGLLIDTLLIRPIFTPAVLTLLGRASSWPSHYITTGTRVLEPTQEHQDA